MSTVELKEKIQKRLSEIDNEALLQEIYDLVCEDQEPYILSAEQKLRIEKARKEIQEGQIISEEEANRKTEEWLKK